MRRLLYLGPMSLLCIAVAAPQTTAVSPFGSRTTAPAAAAAAKPASGAVLPAGTPLRVRLENSINTARNRAGDHFTASLVDPVMSGGRELLPRGTRFTGHVTTSNPSGRLKGRAVLGIRLDSFQLNGRTYPVTTTGVSRASGTHKKRNLALIGGGSGVGAAIGGIAAGGAGALIGAGAGAAAGTVGAAVTGKKNVSLPVESLLRFTLRSPVHL